MEAYIQQETLAVEVITSPPAGISLTAVEINGEEVALAIEKSIDS